MSPIDRAKRLAGVGAAALLLSLSVAGQVAAHLLGYAEPLGPGLPLIGLVRLYPPWAVIDWQVRYGAAYPQVFDAAALAGLLAFLGPVGLFAAATRRFVARPKPFGLKSWGGLAEARRAGLANGEAIVGRVLGRLQGRLLTFLGVEHCIIVGASRSGKGAGHVVPTVLAWDKSLFVYDRKGELWHITADHRRRFSHTLSRPSPASAGRAPRCRPRQRRSLAALLRESPRGPDRICRTAGPSDRRRRSATDDDNTVLVRPG